MPRYLAANSSGVRSLSWLCASQWPWRPAAYSLLWRWILASLSAKVLYARCSSSPVYVLANLVFHAAHLRWSGADLEGAIAGEGVRANHERSHDQRVQREHSRISVRGTETAGSDSK